MTSEKQFHLEYISGSALMENNGIGSGGIMLDDQIVNDWTRIGYDELDGRIPGCYKYDSYITVKMKPVFEE